MKRALISGIAGFAGSHLARHLIERGWNVAGIERHGASLNNLTSLLNKIRLEECDILSAKDVGAVLKKHRPEVVFHLAGTSFVPAAQNAPQMAFEINVKGSLNLLEETRENAPRARVILISSGEVYGKALPREGPLTEKRPPRPLNVYALTKLCAEKIASYYHRTVGLDCVIIRPFNHIGPGQRPSFVTAAFALQIAEIEAGAKPPVLRVGNLKARRDFTDVRDMVRAYRLAAEKCRGGKAYNVCSGKVYSIKTILEKLLSLTSERIEVRRDRKRMRKVEIPLYRGDFSRFRRATGWKPEYGLDSTLKSILDYWRGQVKKDWKEEIRS